MKRRHLFAALGVLAIVAATPAVAWAFTFTRIIDTDTAAPEGGGLFTWLGAPSLRGGNLGFLAAASANPIGDAYSRAGIYTIIDGTLALVANYATPAPGSGGGYFGYFPGMSFDGQSVAFGADVWEGTTGGRRGFYTNQGGSLRVVANQNTALPGGHGNWTWPFAAFVHYPQIADGRVTFWGYTPINPTEGYQGIFIDDGGQLSIVADTETEAPGNGARFLGFSSHGAASSAAGSTFTGGDGITQGAYSSTHSGLAAIAVNGTPVPDGLSTFSYSIGSSQVNASGTVAFEGGSSPGNRYGIYFSTSGVTLRTAVQTGMAGPDSLEPFTLIWSDYALGEDYLAFSGLQQSQPQSLYFYDFASDSIARVLSLGMVLDGNTVSGFELGPEALDGNQLAFSVNFTDSSRAIYVATIPEPATAGLVLLGWMWIVGRSRQLRQECGHI